MTALRRLVLAVRFLCELGMLLALMLWGFHVGEGSWAFILGIGAPALAAAVWGLFVAPKAVRPVRLALRVSIEIDLFTISAVALWFAGHRAWAVALGVLGIGTSLANAWQEGRGEPLPRLAPMRVRPATVEEVPTLAALLARAFADDAIMVWTAPEPDREARVAAFFREFDTHAAAHGWLWTTDGLEGVALWAPPGSEAVFEQVTFELSDGVRELLGTSIDRYDSFWGWAEGLRPSEPHWYLDHVAVERGARGSGVGSALVAHGLERARADGVVAFLCTSRPDNVAFYERRGFAVETAGDAPDGGPHVWFMRWDP